ncbi:MAG: efflux RND transporter permease subunit, partial [Lachnospiraceae bacterium]|nr:efflux RND transporter permease subunit [Lachnospiraceae bacterium]
MPKFSVKKPYTVVVGVVMLLILGFISFTKMTTDLLPTMELPYVLVMTTYPGATPERVEANVTEPLEASLGTVNGVKNVMSTSSENFSLVFLEFEEGTNMDSAMVKLSTALDLIQMPDMVGTPMLLELSPDMLPTMVVSVDYDGKDIYDLSEFAETVVVPYLERQDGVANVETSGLIHQYLEVRLDQVLIDEINDDLLAQVNEKLDEAKEELDEGIKKLEEAKQQMEDGKKELENQQNTTSNQLAEASKQLNQALATKAAYEAQVTTLTAQKAALEAELAAYREVMDGIYQQILASFDQIRDEIQSEAYHNKVRVEIVSQVTGREDITYENVQEVIDGLDEETKTAVTEAIALRIGADLAQVPKDLFELITDEAKREAFIEQLKGLGENDLADQMTPEMLEGIYQVVLRVTQLESALANLNTELIAAQAVLDQVSKVVDIALNNYNALEAGKITAAAGFGAAAAQIANGEATLAASETQLEEAKKAYESAREAAIKNANLDALLNMETLANILLAQNFEMPAGYILEETGSETQYMLKIGDELADQEELENLLLVKMDGIGEVRLKDVAQITMIDNAGQSYTKVNGNEAVALTITKASTAGTSAVSKTCNEALAELEEKYQGLHITPLMDQGVYIALIVDSVMSNLLWGALLAILVLIVFLKDAKPTLVVAVSIPFSVLFAVVLMYFSNITLNIISLSGLALGVGMLVDNSIVVIENIYRLRSKGMPAARAAVVGANQVAGAIFSSTLTTVCVFLPIVFVEGLTRDLLQDMGLTIAYSLLASLIVALTLVPSMGATVLKDCKEKEHKWFDAMMRVYEKVLRFCLRVKIVPLAISIALLVFSIYEITQIGIVL